MCKLLTLLNLHIDLFILRTIDSLIQQIHIELQPVYLFSVYIHSSNKNLSNLLGASTGFYLCVCFLMCDIDPSLGALFIHRRKHSEHWLS